MDTMLHDVFGPRITGVPPGDAHRDLMRLADGRIRHYGRELALGDDGMLRSHEIYTESSDEGLSWRTNPAAIPSVGGMVFDPARGDYWTVLHCHGGVNRHGSDDYYSALWAGLCPEAGVYLFRAPSPDGPFTARRIWPEVLHVQRQPLVLRRNGRFLVPFQVSINQLCHPGVLLSDDNGENWRRVLLSPTPVPDKVVWPHRGLRWLNPGAEPIVAENPAGKLIMLLRTSQDCFYRAESLDGGDSWSTPAPSCFWGTATMPNLVTLRDGRMLAIWNNNTPLPEVDHALQVHLSERERAGMGEDMFTNRDAIHAAISEDGGDTWTGFRELHLNERRNDADFRLSGTALEIDKSVHQNQLLELEDRKILVAFGQHHLCRKFVVFDPTWLYESCRANDFRNGLRDWSVHTYLKGINGMTLGYRGHCSLNRQFGATPVPDPTGGSREVLRIARHPDPRLMHEKQGAVWNFPAGRRGEVTVELYLTPGSAGLQLSLCDRWFNPVDPVVGEFAPAVFNLDSAGRINGVPALTPGEWLKLTLRWDLDAASSVVEIGELRIPGRCGGHAQTPLQISYLHLQSIAENTDECGVLIASVSKRDI